MSQFSAEWAGTPGPQGDAFFVHPESLLLASGDKDFVPSALVRDVRSLEPRDFLFLEEPFQTIAQDNGVRARFVEVPGMEASRQRNSQGLVFGQLIMTSDTEHEVVDLVAIKPYNHPRGAVREAVAMDTVNHLETPRRSPLSFLPLGFYRFPDGRQTGLITRYDLSVLTQDNIFWDPDREPSKEETHRAFEHAAVALGGLHRHGLAHGDAQVKNVARDSLGPRIADLTDMSRMTPEDALGKITRDLGFYVGSLVQGDAGGVIGVRTFDRDYSKPLMDVFVPRYLKESQGPGALPKDAQLQTADISQIITDNNHSRS